MQQKAPARRKIAVGLTAMAVVVVVVVVMVVAEAAAAVAEVGEATPQTAMEEYNESGREL